MGAGLWEQAPTRGARLLNSGDLRPDGGGRCLRPPEGTPLVAQAMRRLAPCQRDLLFWSGHFRWRCAGYNRPVHFVYIVRCADGTLYTGYARDPRARERAHNRGRGAKYTAGRRPVRLVYQEAFRSVGKALAREYVVKQLTRVQKDALVVSARRRHH